MDSIKTNFSSLLKKNNEIIVIPTKQGPKEYIRYEGWITIATVLGIMPRIVEVQATPKGYQAKAEAVHVKTGQVVGAAYGLCSKDEPSWATRPDFAILSMAQTRAASRCLKSILGGVITHLGYEGAPAEIAEEEEAAAPKGSNPNPASAKQLACIYAISKKNGIEDAELKEMMKNEFGKEHSKDLTVSEASSLIEKIQK